MNERNSNAKNQNTPSRRLSFDETNRRAQYPSRVQFGRAGSLPPQDFGRQNGNSAVGGRVPTQTNRVPNGDTSSRRIPSDVSAVNKAAGNKAAGNKAAGNRAAGSGRNLSQGTASQRTGSQRATPQRATPQRAGRAEASPAKAPEFVKETSVSVKRNLLLAAVFSLLAVVSIIVFSVQSCSSDKGKSYTPKDKNTVRLSADTADSAEAETASPVFAEYTEKSAALTIDSDYGILIDLSTNKVIASKNGEEKIYPASMTKIMTLIVAYENAGSLDRTFTFTSQLLDPLYAANASQAGFAPGETVTVKDMLYGCALPSGGDATVGLAQLIAGGEEAFAEMMNRKAAELGLKNTHFVTVSGLHNDNHYSTCHEIAIILEYAISIPYLREVLGTYKYTTSPTEQHPEGLNLTSTLYNRAVGDEAPGVFIQGGKTGYTNEALNCLATFAARCSEEMAPQVKPEYILVTAHASGEYTPVFDAINVYKTFCGDDSTSGTNSGTNSGSTSGSTVSDTAKGTGTDTAG